MNGKPINAAAAILMALVNAIVGNFGWAVADATLCSLNVYCIVKRAGGPRA